MLLLSPLSLRIFIFPYLLLVFFFYRLPSSLSPRSSKVGDGEMETEREVQKPNDNDDDEQVVNPWEVSASPLCSVGSRVALIFPFHHLSVSLTHLNSFTLRSLAIPSLAFPFPSFVTLCDFDLPDGWRFPTLKGKEYSNESYERNVGTPDPGEGN